MPSVLRIQGDKQLIRKFNELPVKVEKTIARKATREAGRPMLAEAKRNAPVATGKLRKSLKLRALRRSRKGRVGVTVGTSNREFSGEQFYGAFQEYGYHLGKRTSSVRKEQRLARRGRLGSTRDSRRFVEGTHYLERAFATKQGESQRIMQRELWAGIEREATK